MQGVHQSVSNYDILEDTNKISRGFSSLLATGEGAGLESYICKTILLRHDIAFVRYLD